MDLNLLVALEALLAHCNVTRAADAVGLSQPAMSRALSRLRGMFNDDLLVRTSQGYVRTIRGEQLHDRLPVTLDAVRELVSSRNMTSAHWHSFVRLAMPDHQALVLLPEVFAQINTGPMNTKIITEPFAPNMLNRLEKGELDMVVGQVTGVPTGFFQRSLYADGYSCLVRKDHPALLGGWTAERYHGLHHAVTAGHDSDERQMSDVLADMLSKDNCIVLPNTMAAAMAVAQSDMALTVPTRVAVKMAMLLPLRTLELPVVITPYEVMLFWHERSHRNEEHQWVRSQIAAAAHNSGTPDIPAPGIVN